MDTLKNIATIAITIAGFSALITVLQKSKPVWEHDDKVNLIRFIL